MNFELIFGLVTICALVFVIWSNESWYKTCQSMNDDWYERLVDLIGTTGEALDEMQKEIDILKDKLEDDGK